jgi:hypothetical protein
MEVKHLCKDLEYIRDVFWKNSAFETCRESPTSELTVNILLEDEGKRPKERSLEGR